MHTTLAELTEHKIISIIRGVTSVDVLPVANALYRGGIRFIEVTFNASSLLASDDTLQSIRLLRKKMGDKIHIGAGTVLTPVQVELAADAGAEYIISPDMNPDVIHHTKELGLLSLPGALTPTEIQAAWAAGADMVKVFPASLLGPAYFKALKAPLSQVKLAAVGGVDETNIRDFLKAGADGLGIGGCLVNNDRVSRKAWNELERSACNFVGAICQPEK